MSKQSLHIVHLYPKEMNIYGDTGNRLVFERRLEWRGIEPKVSLVGIGDKVPLDTDILLGGGAQDAAQSTVEKDLQLKASTIKKLVEDGVSGLMVCGMYQLLGDYFTTSTGQKIEGIKVLPLYTQAGATRFIGNTIYATDWGHIVGYENHSGLTFLKATAKPLGRVLKGAGNNGQDSGEGCIYKNIFGTYSHGPVLCKNPALADEIIQRALMRKYGAASLEPLDDALELEAAKFAEKRPR